MTSAEAKYAGIYASGGSRSPNIGTLTILQIGDTGRAGVTSMSVRAMGSNDKGSTFVLSPARLNTSGAGDRYFENAEQYDIEGKLDGKPITNATVRIDGEIAELTVLSRVNSMTIRYARVDDVTMDPASAQPFVTLAAGEDGSLWQDPLITQAKDTYGKVLQLPEGAPLEVTQSKLVEDQTTNARGEKTGASFQVFSLVNILGKKDVSGWIPNENLVGCAFSGGGNSSCVPVQAPAAH
jgi:hypothetical protein